MDMRGLRSSLRLQGIALVALFVQLSCSGDSRRHTAEEAIHLAVQAAAAAGIDLSERKPPEAEFKRELGGGTWVVSFSSAAPFPPHHGLWAFVNDRTGEVEFKFGV